MKVMYKSTKGILQAALTLLVLLLVADTANAQRRGGTPEQQRERFEEQNKELIAALELTEAQTPLFLEVMEASFADRMDILEDMQAGERSGIREKMAALEENTTEALMEVLNEDQMVKYQELSQQRRRGRGQGRRSQT